MIVRSCGTRSAGDDYVARSVEVENASTEARTITVKVPRGFSPADADDVSGPLGLAVLMAMRAGEDLKVEGLVDPGLHARLGEIRDLYRALDPTLHPAAVIVRGLLKRSRPPSPLAGVYLSRGVDSMYAAATGRTSAGLLDCAIFIDALVPGDEEAVREQELRMVGEASKRLGLPLVVVEAPLRRWTDGIFDWADAVGAGLAWVAHELSGGLGRVVIPSTDSVNTLGDTCGTSPALDPLFSSRAMTIEHGFVSRTRMGKVGWIAEYRRDLLPLLRVCLTENRADNCGLCLKCLHTMVCLRAAGALTQASLFPPELNLDVVAALRLPLLSLRYEFSMARAAADQAGDRPLAEAVGVALEATARSGTVAQQHPIDSFRAAKSNMYVTLIASGRMNRNAGMTDLQAEPIKGIPLLRRPDRRRRRHFYAAGSLPGDAGAELGALLPARFGATVPVWLLRDGRVATNAYVPAAPHADASARWRYLRGSMTAPGTLRHRLRRAIARSRDLWVSSRRILVRDEHVDQIIFDRRHMVHSSGRAESAHFLELLPECREELGDQDILPARRDKADTWLIDHRCSSLQPDRNCCVNS